MRPRRKPRDPVALGDVLTGILKPSRLGGRHRVARELREAWVRVAGPDLASHTCVSHIRRGVLTIEVDSSPLCHSLASFQREEYLLALKTQVQRVDISDLRFRAGDLSCAAHEEGPTVPPLEAKTRRDPR